MRKPKAPRRQENSDRPTPFKIFFVFASITTVTLGGAYVIVPVMGRALEKRGWMDEGRFYDIFARAQSLPGPQALSTALLISRELCGLPGAVAAFFGVVLPPFLAIIIVGKFIAAYGDLAEVRRFLEGAGAVVPGIVAAMILNTARRRKWNIIRICGVSALAALLILFPSESVPIVALAIPLLYLIESLWKPSK
jgi:chromate transporter